MKYIISGTDRPDSNSLKVSEYIQSIYKKASEEVEIIDVKDLDLNKLEGAHYGAELPKNMQEALDKINKAEGLIFVVPEYNGSYPGALKLFIDHWSYPQSFEGRPVCFVGIGGRWGGLRPVEHLQQVFNYRNAYQFPERVFITNVGSTLQNGDVSDSMVQGLLEKQVEGFQRFVEALKGSGLINHVL
ncbi:MAG: NAD(P)H-dependent oxidoreductase [Bdellovibrionales bacterium]|nr:NAD(P)H-dependent oxidoreductase [Bdellovibrionales bacterium]